MNNQLIGKALERKLRERALRADSEIQLDAETLERWVREELEAIMREHALAEQVAGRRKLSN